MSLLFTPYSLNSPRGPLELPNRIVVAPMCQYSASQGEATDWHLMHWGNLLNSGAGLFIIEATGVTPEARITPACLGLWDDRTEAALKDKLTRARKLAPATPVFIQLAHAGRKASSATPWDGGQLLALDQGGWETLAPSSILSSTFSTLISGLRLSLGEVSIFPLRFVTYSTLPKLVLVLAKSFCI